MTTIIFIIIVAVCLIIMLSQREKIKELEKKISEITSEKSKLSNSVREKGALVDNLRKHNRRLLRRLDEQY